MRYPFRQTVAALLLAVFVTGGLAGCGGQVQPQDDWQINPPGQGPALDDVRPDGATDPVWTQTGAAAAAASSTASAASPTAAATSRAPKKTTARVTRPRPTEPPDDPQRPKEEEEDSGPVVTLPPVRPAPTTAATTAKTAVTTANTANTGGSVGTTTTAKPTPPTRPPIKLPSNGIDVSTFQKSIDWNRVKAAGVDFAMIRVGARGYGSAGNMFMDAWFEENIEGATAAGVDRGVYFFSQAITVKEAIEEANYVLNAIRGYTLTYPIAFDFENPPHPDARTQVLNSPGKKSFNTDLVLAFCDTIRAAGYYPLLYTGMAWQRDRLDISRIQAKYDVWLAHYKVSKPGYSPVAMWQYSSTGRVPGITGNVDMNYGYVDYAHKIRELGLNHLK